MKIPKTKIIMNFETSEEFQEQLKRVQSIEFTKNENSKKEKFKNVEYIFEKDKEILKADGIEITQTLDSITGSISNWSAKKENYTLDDLKQKLINNLYNATYYEKNDIEILKILFENNDI